MSKVSRKLFSIVAQKSKRCSVHYFDTCFFQPQLSIVSPRICTFRGTHILAIEVIRKNFYRTTRKKTVGIFLCAKTMIHKSILYMIKKTFRFVGYKVLQAHLFLEFVPKTFVVLEKRVCFPSYQKANIFIQMTFLAQTKFPWDF